MVEQQIDELYNQVWAEQENVLAKDNLVKLNQEIEDSDEITLQLDNDYKVISSKKPMLEIEQPSKLLVKITPQQCRGIIPVTGNLNGTFADCLNYLDWTINTHASKGKFTTEQRGKMFAEAVQTLKDMFGYTISTHYLKQFCKKQKHKNLHVGYMLKIANLETEPTKIAFRGGIANGRRCFVPKIFDFIVSKQEFENNQSRAEQFRQRCIAEWEAEKLQAG